MVTGPRGEGMAEERKDDPAIWRVTGPSPYGYADPGKRSWPDGVIRTDPAIERERAVLTANSVEGFERCLEKIKDVGLESRIGRVVQ